MIALVLGASLAWAAGEACRAAVGAPFTRPVSELDRYRPVVTRFQTVLTEGLCIRARTPGSDRLYAIDIWRENV